MDYYKKLIYIPHVDRKDRVLGPVERWKAHREGILHRGFTIGLLYKDFFICQHRKHPVFGGFFDLTASSHPQYKNKTLQTHENAVFQTLSREWNLSQEDLDGEIKEKGKVYYRSSFGKYIEHEICYFFTARVKKVPQVNYEFAYGFSLLTLSDLKDEKSPYVNTVAPWVKQALKENLFM